MSDEIAHHPSPKEEIWTPITSPGLAVPVYAELVSTRGRDSLQRAVIGLLRCGSMTADNIAADLGIAEAPLIEAVLRSLLDEGAVLIDDNLYRTNEDSGRPESGIGVRGWMFWDGLQKRFVPRLFINKENRHLRVLFAEEMKRREEWVEHIPKPESAELWRAVQRDDFSIQMLNIQGGKRQIIPELDWFVRSISFSQDSRSSFFPLVVLVETRLRIAGAPAFFFHEPQVTADNLSEPIYAPNLAGLIENSLPHVFAEVRAEGQRRNDSFLSENHAEFFIKLGGIEKITVDAGSAVHEQLRGISLREEFNVPELHDTARQAEISRILCRHGLREDADTRRDFAALLQLIARILGDEMGALLARQDFRRALDQLETEFKALPSNAARQDECNLRIDKSCREFGLHYRGWKLGGHMSKPSSLRGAIGDSAQRSQLGAAFSLWLLPPILAGDCEDGANHIRWMHLALRECPDLLDIYDSTARQRHLDKGSKSSEFVMSLEAFATNTYRIWRGLGIC